MRALPQPPDFQKKNGPLFAFSHPCVAVNPTCSKFLINQNPIVFVYTRQCSSLAVKTRHKVLHTTPSTVFSASVLVFFSYLFAEFISLLARAYPPCTTSRRCTKVPLLFVLRSPGLSGLRPLLATTIEFFIFHHENQPLKTLPMCQVGSKTYSLAVVGGGSICLLFLLIIGCNFFIFN